MDKNQYLKMFWKNNRANFLLGCLFLTIISATQIAIAFALQMLIDIATEGTLGELLRLIVFSGIVLAVYIFAAIAQKIFLHRFFFKALTAYKAFSFAQMFSKNINAFNSSTTGQYISALSNDVSSIEKNYLESMFELIGHILLFSGGVMAMAYYNWTLFLCVMGASVLPVLVSVIFGGRIAAEEKRVSDLNEQYVSGLKDMLSGFSTIKSFKAEPETAAVFKQKDNALEKTKKRRRDALVNVEIMSGVASILVLLVVFVIGALLSINDVISAGVMIAFIQLLNYVVGPIQQLPPLFGKIKAAKGLARKAQQEISHAETRKGGLTIGGFYRQIRFSGVSFGYGQGTRVLQDLNLCLEKGKTYAITGVSGSGKSTLVNLLLGYHSDYDGQITIDGVDINQINTDSLYELISVIQQNVFIFDDDIRSNITMRKKFDEEKVTAAIAQAGLEELIKIRGVDYKCGENGCNLSGGERQRISIARSLLKKTPILLMDEATASLDNETAAVIEEAILSLKGITRVIVTHKMSAATLRRYDEIIFLRNGAIEEKGSFEELIKRGGHFRALYDVSE